MRKFILFKDQVRELICANSYKVPEKTKFLSRCVDGRYETSDNLVPLAIPGADLGEITLVMATGNSYGFEVDLKKTVTSLLEIIGGVENFQFHTDTHADREILASGCGLWRQVNLDPAAFDLEKNQVKDIGKVLTTLKKQGAKETVLIGDHLEGAVLQVKGNCSIYPRLFIKTAEGNIEIEVFVYQGTLVDERHKLLAKKLIKNKAVKLFPGCDWEYLYQVLSDEAERHLFEILKRLADGLPLYLVEFDQEANFDLAEMEKVI